MTRFSSVLVTATALVLAALPAGVGAASADQPDECEPGCEVWTTRYSGGEGNDQIKAFGVDPAGQRLYVTGWVYVSNQLRWATVAFDAATGEQVWAVHAPNLPGENIPEALAVSPDGARVYVAGRVGGGVGLQSADYGLRAYEAETGEELWLGTYDGEAGGQDSPRAVAVSHDGATVFVTGNSQGFIDLGLSTTSTDFATVAFDAANGEERWSARYDGAQMADLAVGLAVSPDDDRVFVTGSSPGVPFVNLYDYATLAYDAATGDELWEARYQGPARGFDAPADVAVSHDGATVFVTGTSDGAGGSAAATIAYDAASGGERWVARLEHPWMRASLASALALDPDGSRLYVTARSAEVADVRVHTEPFPQAGWDSQFTVLAYDPTDGEELWVTSHDLGDGDIPMGLTAGAGMVVATGYTSGPDGTFDRATLALHAATGQALWLAGPDDPGESAWAADAAISPDGTLAFVLGQGGPTGEREFLVSAYRLGEAPQDPQIVDARGDAHGLGDAVTQDARPASVDEADLLWGRFETTYVGIPVGEDGIRYEATGLIVRLGTAAPPSADGLSLAYALHATVGDCRWTLSTTLRGQFGHSSDPADGGVTWTQEGACPGGETTLTHPEWTVAVWSLGREMAIEIPFSSLGDEQAALLERGQAITQPNAAAATLGYPTPTGERVGARVLDFTPEGATFVVGSDIPPDVPCTRGCPDPEEG